MSDITAQPRLSNEEISRQAEGIYARDLRVQVETDNNIGKILLLDVKTGHYEIDEEGITANKRLRANHPETNPMALFAIRVGYDAVYAIGGTITRTNR